METTYSILYCPIRPSVDERVTVAMLISNGEDSLFQYSKEKLLWAKQMLPEGSYRLLNGYITSIDKFYNAPGIQPSEELQKHLVMLRSDISRESHLNYLASYTHNLIQFSKPVRIEKEMNVETLLMLFNKFVFSPKHILEPAPSKVWDVKRLKTEKKPALQPYVNVDTQLTPAVVPGLCVPSNVWFIGKNDREVAGEALDFGATITTVRNHVLQYLNIVRALENNHPKLFWVSEEPDKLTQPQQHEIWKGLYNNKQLDFVPHNEFGQIEHYLYEHEVKPLFVK
jgi:hypothetical protein